MRAPGAVAAGPDSLTYTQDRRKRRAIIASIITGTTIEWYDFYLFVSLAKIIGPHFYKTGNQYSDLLIWLATYATGFLIRPVGAAYFGRLGDLKGRKSAFLVTLLLMCGATTAIGFLPGYATVGALAPALLVLMRLIQGFALGGEYGGAVIFVAENVPDGERGYYTSYVQGTATLGLSRGTIPECCLGTAEFDAGAGSPLPLPLFSSRSPLGTDEPERITAVGADVAAATAGTAGRRGAELEEAGHRALRRCRSRRSGTPPSSTRPCPHQVVRASTRDGLECARSSLICAIPPFTFWRCPIGSVGSG